MSAPRPIDRLIEIMAALRTPVTGCPWDLEQDFGTIAPYTIEEAYEVADAIGRGDLDDLKDELGDLLLQVVFHARMAEEQGAFAFDDVANAISDKMVRRHPHVFGDASADGAAAVKIRWEDIKAEEKRQRSVRRERAGKANDDTRSLLDDIPVALPALTRAVKLQRRAARVGFDWKTLGPVLDKIREEIDEVEAEAASEPRDTERLAEEIGDLLFAVANLARHAGADPEDAARRANAKFQERFATMEAQCRAEGTSLEALTLEQMEELWQAAKQAEYAGSGD